MTDNTKNELTAIANISLRQLEAKASLPGNWHTKVIGFLSHVTDQNENRATVEVSFFDTHRGLTLWGSQSVWIRVMIVVNRFGVVRTVVWTGGNGYFQEKKTAIDGKDACETAKMIAAARAAA